MIHGPTMPSVVHPPLVNTAFMLKEKSGEPLVSAFTAVNGRTSPPSPRRSNGTNGMMADAVHVRPHARTTPDHTQDQKTALAGRDSWSTVPAQPTGNHPLSPAASGTASPRSPGKRKRSSSVEDNQSAHSSGETRTRVDSYVSPSRDALSPPVSQIRQLPADRLQQRSLPPLEQAEADRDWPLKPHEMPPSGYSDPQNRDMRSMEPPQDAVLTHASQHSQMNVGEPNDYDRASSTTEITRAGVHVDPKRRKRQFANRTKTGCGTCRRRKKKCDEAKPECNNCSRGGFICEGYANKVPWPKNGSSKPHPPLQAKDRFPVDAAQMYHSHGTNREPIPEPTAPNGSEGARSRPIVVDEHDRSDRRNGWGTNWGESTRPSYPPEHHQPSEYSQPPPTSSHGRPSSHDHHIPHPSQGAPTLPRPTSRIYHHTPQTMSQVVNNSHAVTAEAALHHQSQQTRPPHHIPPPTAGPPGPPPPQYAPPPPVPQRSEKEKMLNGDLFEPNAPQLVEEREKCQRAVWKYNNTNNDAIRIDPRERDRLFLAIVAARWIYVGHGSDPPRVGHVGPGCLVDSPFKCDYGYNISIGENVEIGSGCKFLDSGRIAIGRNTTIGANVVIDTQKMPMDSKALKGSRRATIAAEVWIGENVHIGANCTVLAGVRIGTGATIHPGSVVVRDIPRDCVARGNPAEVRSVNWAD